MLIQIISGGQTGADQAGLRAAKRCEIPTGGWACHGFKTEAGQALWLATEFGLREHPEPGYSARTRDNVRDSTGTVIFGQPSSGCNLTQRFCGPTFYNKPWLWVHWPQPYEIDQEDVTATVLGFLILQRIEILNVAGNREEKNPGIGAWVEQTLTEVLHAYRSAGV
jgi:hypothetical protein